MRRISPTRIHGTGRDVKANLEHERNLNTYDELFVPQGDGEVSIESHPEVLSIITLVHYNVFQQYCLMTEDLGQSSTSSR